MVASLAKALYSFRRDIEGATAVEYGLVVGLVAATCLVGLQLIGTNILDVLGVISAAVEETP